MRGGKTESGANCKWNRGFIEATIPLGGIGFPDSDATIDRFW
jgi:hypothetical protein